MNAQEQIEAHLASQPEPKRSEMRELHRVALRVSPGCKLWFHDGRDEQGRIVCNPTIGYGSLTLALAKGKTKESFQVGMSANQTGISIYLIGVKDKTYLARNYGKKLGKASVTGYCIKFKTLKDTHLDVLEAVIRHGFEPRRDKPA